MKRERMVVKESTSKDELEASAARLLLLTGVPANMNGYRYLLTSVMLVCQDDQLIGAITTRLYPVVAKMHGVTKTRVERSIRNAIDAAWSRGLAEKMNTIFGGLVLRAMDKPTNGEFIALLALKIYLDQKEDSAGGEEKRPVKDPEETGLEETS